MNLTARDFARLGELFRNNGTWNGKQIVPAEWVAESTRIDSAIREPGRPIVSDHPIDLGYGYQWWIPAGDRGEFCALGVLNQLIYVDPPTKSVIVKLSANRLYGTTNSEDTDRNVENVAALQAIARHLGG